MMKLLLADDDRPTRIKMRHIIEKWGYKVVEADNGKTAFNILHSPDPPRIALLDWIMPEMDGVQICMALSKDNKIPLIYRILVTSKQDKEDIVTALDSGAHDFLSKPVDNRELRSRIAVGERLVQSEDNLKESQRQLSTLMSNLPGMAYRCSYDQSRPVEFISNGCLSLTGTPSEKWKQKDSQRLSDIIHPDDRKPVWNKIQAAVSKHKPFQCTYRIQITDNQIKWVWEQGRGIFENEQEPLALEGFVTDITEQMRLEEALVESKKMEAIARLAGGIAHDFNNYFMIIRFYTENLLKSIPDIASIREDVETIREIGQRASSLSKNLLAFSQNQFVKLEEMNIHLFLPQLEKTLTPLLPQSIKLEINPLNDTGVTQANPGQIEQIIMNLVLNSRDAIENEGTITIQSQNIDLNDESTHLSKITSPCVKISVEDSGTGIEENIKKQIFEPFFTTKSTGNETGLGLSIVFGIVKQLGGTLDIESEMGKGTTLNLLFPRINQELSS